jgi:hypothetical protein
LAKRQGEVDYDGTYSFIGGKMETTDDTIVDGIKREKDEEISAATKIKILPHETYNVLFRKKDGNSMIVPHIAGVFLSGEIVLSDEYSEYKWVLVEELRNFEPKVENIPELVKWAVSKLSSVNDDQLVEI